MYISCISVRWSNLHLIHWDRVIIDHRNLGNIRCGTVRGDAITALRADSRVSVVEQEGSEEPLSTHVQQGLCDFLEIRGDLLADAYYKVD
jgi:hypothetical protein